MAPELNETGFYLSLVNTYFLIPLGHISLELCSTSDSEFYNGLNCRLVFLETWNTSPIPLDIVEDSLTSPQGSLEAVQENSKNLSGISLPYHVYLPLSY